MMKIFIDYWIAVTNTLCSSKSLAIIPLISIDDFLIG